jgi:hypothetical protein
MNAARTISLGLVIIALHSSCSKGDGAGILPPELLWVGSDVRTLTEDERIKLGAFLKDELRWAERLAESGNSTGSVKPAGQLARIEATTRGLYLLVAEAKQNALRDGSAKIASPSVPKLLARASARTSPHTALVLGQYPTIGMVVFRIDRIREPLAYDSVVAALGEACAKEAAEEFSLLRKSEGK